MKILHFKSTMRLEEGGVVKAVLDLVRMTSTTDSVGVATSDPSGLPEEWRNGRVPSIAVTHLQGNLARGGMLTGEQLKQLRHVIEQFDVVHLHSMWSLANPQVARICNETGIPYVLSVHGMLDDWCMSQRRFKKQIYLKTIGRRLLRDARMVHCTAQAELDQASGWFDRSKGVSIPLPFDLSEYATMPDPEEAYRSFAQLKRDKPKVLFLSRIHLKKGVDRLIRASFLLQSRGIDHQLVVAGTGDDVYVQQMKKLARDLGIADQTYFLGFANGSPKLALFDVCDIFALPTSQENFGFVFFESFAAGTMVLTTKGTDTWQDIERSGGGVIADNTPEAFAAAIERLLAAPERVRSMGQAGRDWVFQEMRPEHVRAGYLKMYHACVERQKGV